MRKILLSHLKTACLLFIFVFSSIFANAQEDTKKTYTPQVIPPSPESQIFERYLNHEIDECSGTPSINIPLYEVKIKGLTIPIQLSYDASGVKYDQFDGTLGVGWSIQSMGYRVFREIHGRPDEKYPFFNQSKLGDALNNYNNPAFGYYFLAFVPGNECLKVLPQDRYGLVDGEYDLFSYMLPSSGGSFIITDREKMNTATIEKNGDKIALNKVGDGPWTQNYNLLSMLVIDKNGYIYELGGTNSSGEKLNDITKIGNGIEAYNGWALKKISSPYGETVEFDYEIIDYVSRNRLVGSPIGVQITDPPHYFIQSGTTHARYSLEEIYDQPNAQKGFVLKKIKTENATVEFLYNDVQGGLLELPSLKIIIVKNKQGEEIKWIGFNYNTLIGNKWHRMLESVEEGKGQEKIRKYNFDYYLPNESINDIRNVSPDQWGYYSQNHEPWGYFTPLALHEELRNYRFILQDYVPGGRREPLSIISGLNNCFFDRSKNYGLLHSFSLKRITFPTGGYTEYEYEPHKYRDSENIITTGGGQRVKRIVSKVEESSLPVATGFKYGENESGMGVANFPWLDESHFVQESYHYFIPGEVNQSTYNESRSYMMSPIMPEFSKFNVSYKEISTYKVDTKNSIMTKMTSKYNLPEQYKYDGLIMRAQASLKYNNMHLTYGNQVEVYDYSLGLKPNLRERIYYDDRLDIVRKEEYLYEKSVITNYEGFKVRQSVFFNLDYRIDGKDPRIAPFTYVKQLCNYIPYYVKVGVNNLLLSKKVTENGIVTEEKFNYDEYLQVKSISRYNSQAVERKEEYIYPYNLGEDIYKAMVNRNIITPVVEKNVTYNGRNEAFFEKTHYTNMGSMILPSKIETSMQSTNNLRTNIIFDRYDSKGNLLQYTTPDGITTIILWSYLGQYPIAEIKGATYLEVEPAAKSAFGVTSIDALSQKSSVTEAQLNDFRNHTSVKNALVTTYTYKPLVGMSTATDPRGVTTYYEYDSFGRLKDTYIEELDSVGNKVRRKAQSYNYYYQNK